MEFIKIANYYIAQKGKGTFYKKREANVQAISYYYFLIIINKFTKKLLTDITTAKHIDGYYVCELLISEKCKIPYHPHEFT